MFKRLWRRLTCRHESMLIHIEDVYGDRIFTMPRFTRSIWRCPDCGKILYKNYLSTDFKYIREEQK